VEPVGTRPLPWWDVNLSCRQACEITRSVGYRGAVITWTRCRGCALSRECDMGMTETSRRMHLLLNACTDLLP